VYQFLSETREGVLVRILTLFCRLLLLFFKEMSGNQEEKEFRQPEASNLQMQVMLGEMRLRAELEPINERLDRVEAGTPRG
jgi:hypothetical protein